VYRSVLVVLIGCSEPSGASFVAPFDGATSIAPEAELSVTAGYLGLPDGYPIDPALLTVTRLPLEEPVAGKLIATHDTITFAPADAWENDADYRWVVTTVDAVVRQIRPELPETVEGAATFSISDRPVLLEAVLDTGILCLVFSQPMTADDLLVGVAGRTPVPIGYAPVDPLDAVEIPTDLPGTPGAVCLDTPLGAVPGDTLTWMSESGVPTEVPVEPRSVHLAVLARFRWSPP
jgi:hypothetical protein